MYADYSLVYITASDKESAYLMAKSLLEERLIACANITSDVRSIYWWEGNINENNEAMIFAKTTSSNVDRIIDHIKIKHNYSCTCVIALPIHQGNPSFLSWIKDNVA
jgi:periplasmic divalent cation tolerance protein